MGDRQALINKQQQNHYLSSAPRGCQIFLIVTYSWWAGASISFVLVSTTFEICCIVKSSSSHTTTTSIYYHEKGNRSIHRLKRCAHCIAVLMLVCQANWFLAKSACQEPTDRTHEHNLQAVLFIITSTIWRLGSTKLQQFAAMFALVDSLRPHEHTSLRGGYLAG